MSMRLDRFLCEVNIGSRSQVREGIKKGLVQVNGSVIKKPEYKVDEVFDTVLYQNKVLSYRQFAYYMLNKPAGMVTSNQDPVSSVVMELFKDVADKDLFPAGRLDKDAEGFLLVTNDGALAHKLLAPKSHVPKTYFLKLAKTFTKEQADRLAGGVDIGEKKMCAPAQTKQLSEDTIYITIQEGKFHQVKRMLQKVGNEVLYLKRVSFGSLSLDETLAVGEFRPLTEEEIAMLEKDVLKDVEE